MDNEMEKTEITNTDKELTEGTDAVHIVSNLIITTVSIAALVLSLVKGSKLTRRK